MTSTDNLTSIAHMDNDAQAGQKAWEKSEQTITSTRRNEKWL